jgi:hypothetical protein
MSNQLLTRTMSLAMAAVVTASLLLGIDGLAVSEHAANHLMAQASAAGLMA